MNTKKKIADTTHPRSTWKHGQRFHRDMGCRANGVVVTARELPYGVLDQICIRTPFRFPVIPVRYDNGTFGYEHRGHIKPINP